MTSTHRNNESRPLEQTSVEQRKGEKRFKNYDVYREGYQAGQESMIAEITRLRVEIERKNNIIKKGAQAIKILKQALQNEEIDDD